MRHLLLFGILAAASAQAQLQIEKPWIRATTPGATVAAGYMLIRNKSATPERLIAVRSPAAERVEMHVHTMEGDIMRMREVKGYDVPANGSFELKPGGGHLMFVDIKRPFKEGEKIPAVLVFRRAGEVKVAFQVARLAASSAGHMH